MWSLFTGKITAGDVGRGIVFADSFVLRHANMIPPDVKRSWDALRAALSEWKDRLEAQERGTL